MFGARPMVSWRVFHRIARKGEPSLIGRHGDFANDRVTWIAQRDAVADDADLSVHATGEYVGHYFVGGTV